MVKTAVTKDPREPVFNLSSSEDVPMIFQFACQHFGLTYDCFEPILSDAAGYTKNIKVDFLKA